ncbi:MAG TPA: hypothetical protein VLX92_28500 [Kofleriaceae bacterium]|nr:hypothetical protein [Kofleriaceae bacterium]
MARWSSSALVVVAACGHRDAPRLGPNDVPVATTAIAVDGELTEPDWNARAMRGVLLGPDGDQMRPYSELRLLRDAHALYVALYAADEDIRSTDAWQLAVGPRTLRIFANGTSDAPDVAVGVDRDGTIDRPSDYDEEWVIEAAIPLATLGAPPLAIAAKRCDTPKDGHERCGQWSGKVGLP